jgi:hypothetical protein
MFKIRWLPRLFGVLVMTMFYACLGNAQVLSSPNLLPTTTHAPDEFGTLDETVTTIAASSFVSPFGFGSASWDPSTSSWIVPFLSSADLWAGVAVPSGVVIDYLGLENLTQTGSTMQIALSVVDRAGTVTPIGSFPSTVHGWDTDYNASPLGFQLIQNMHNKLVVEVTIQSGDGSNGALGWVEIWWHRVVSPAPATATFTDVPTTDPGFQFIEALVASGVTAGCGGGNYCPDSPLTRRQMAVFLSKALGLHWPN